MNLDREIWDLIKITLNILIVQDDIEGITESGGWKKQSDDNSDMEEANNLSTRNTTFRPTNNQNTKNAQVRTRGKYNTTRSKRLEASKQEDLANISERSNFDSENEDAVKSHPWGLVFTVIGTVLLDFDADACQSPSRAYMLDVTIPGKHFKTTMFLWFIMFDIDRIW